MKSENVEDFCDVISVTCNDVAESVSNNKKDRSKTCKKKTKEEKKSVAKRRTSRNSVAAETIQPIGAKDEEDLDSINSDVDNFDEHSDPGKKNSQVFFFNFYQSPNAHISLIQTNQT